MKIQDIAAYAIWAYEKHYDPAAEQDSIDMVLVEDVEAAIRPGFDEMKAEIGRLESLLAEKEAALSQLRYQNEARNRASG